MIAWQLSWQTYDSLTVIVAELWWPYSCRGRAMTASQLSWQSYDGPTVVVAELCRPYSYRGRAMMALQLSWQSYDGLTVVVAELWWPDSCRGRAMTASQLSWLNCVWQKASVGDCGTKLVFVLCEVSTGDIWPEGENSCGNMQTLGKFWGKAVQCMSSPRGSDGFWQIQP